MATERSARRPGLRLRIALVSAVTVGCALLIAAAGVIGLLRSRLDEAATTSATLRARDVASLVEAGALPARLALPGEESAFVQVVDEGGTVVAATENIEGEAAITTARPAAAETLRLTIDDSPLGNADGMRVIAQNAPTPDGGIVTVYAGESLSQARITTRAIVIALALGLPLLVGLVVGVAWWAVGRTLRPVRAITTTMAEITATDLHRRVDERGTRDEIGQLATTVNETLARLDRSMEQQRRLVADASHELRGPLAALRADLEISLTHPAQSNWQSVAAGTLGDVERLEHLTDDLLLLARLDTRGPRARRRVELGAVLRDAAHSVRRSDLVVDVHVPGDPIVIDGEPDQLYRLARNLVHNAEQHARRHVVVTLEADDEVVRITVADDGAGIPAERRSEVFDRFVRLDTARTRSLGGSGLGLAIVRDVATNHGGTVTIGDTEPHGATFVVEIPTATDDGQAR